MRLAGYSLVHSYTHLPSLLSRKLVKRGETSSDRSQDNTRQVLSPRHHSHTSADRVTNPRRSFFNLNEIAMQPAMAARPVSRSCTGQLFIAFLLIAGTLLACPQARAQTDFTRIYGSSDQTVPVPAFVGTLGQRDPGSAARAARLSESGKRLHLARYSSLRNLSRMALVMWTKRR